MSSVRVQGSPACAFGPASSSLVQTAAHTHRCTPLSDLYGGAGGLSCGLEAANGSLPHNVKIVLVASVEYSKEAAAAYRLNHPKGVFLHEGTVESFNDRIRLLAVRSCIRAARHGTAETHRLRISDGLFSLPSDALPGALPATNPPVCPLCPLSVRGLSAEGPQASGGPPGRQRLGLGRGSAGVRGGGGACVRFTPRFLTVAAVSPLRLASGGLVDASSQRIREP